jgi:hypothetical protein
MLQKKAAAASPKRKASSPTTTVPSTNNQKKDVVSSSLSSSDSEEEQEPVTKKKKVQKKVEEEQEEDVEGAVPMSRGAAALLLHAKKRLNSTKLGQEDPDCHPPDLSWRLTRIGTAARKENRGNHEAGRPRQGPSAAPKPDSHKKSCVWGRHRRRSVGCLLEAFLRIIAARKRCVNTSRNVGKSRPSTCLW